MADASTVREGEGCDLRGVLDTGVCDAHIAGMERERPDNLLTSEWEFASPRAEIEPGHGLDDSITRDGAPSLSAWGAGNDACFGRWYQVVEGVRPGGTYRFGVYLRTENVLRLWENVVVRLHWRDDEGREVGKTYIHEHDAEGEWYRISG
ncbi:MAG: hypothetical protein ACE5JM_08705, partial [Armatimonadota bacterium]